MSNDWDWADFAVGDSVAFTRAFSTADFAAFERLSGDSNPLHTDAGYAAKTPFGQPIVPVHLTAAPLSAVAGMMLPGHRSLYLGSDMRALRPVPFDTDIAYSALITAKSEANRTLGLRAIAHIAGEIVMEATMRVQVRDDVAADAAPPRPQHTVPLKRGQDRTVLVTGAAGEIGQALALALARKGLGLVLHHRRPGGVDEALERCRHLGVRADGILADLADEQGRQAVCALIRSRPDICSIVHAASPPVPADLNRHMAIGFAALRDMAAAALPNMLARQQGMLVAVGSSAVQSGVSGWDDYIAAKSAAATFAALFERRYGAYGVHGRVVAPGFVATGFSKPYRQDGTPALIPEELADIVAAEVERAEGGGYLAVEPGFQSLGRFGFHATQQATDTPSKATAPVVSSAGLPQPSQPQSQDFAQFVRSVLRLPSDYDMAGAGLDNTPGWDSLRHIELMLAVEQRFGLSFSSKEIEGTRRFADLARLVAAGQRE